MLKMDVIWLYLVWSSYMMDSNTLHKFVFR